MHEMLDHRAARPARLETLGLPGQINLSLVPLQRLLQIVEELRKAAQGNNLEVACAAARLLAPTLERCTEAIDLQADPRGEAADAALHIRSLLADCEVLLTDSIQTVAAEMKRIRQGKRTLEMARRRIQTAVRPNALDSVQ